MSDDKHTDENPAEIDKMSDQQVRAAYLATSGEPGDPWIDALAAECLARELDL